MKINSLNASNFTHGTCQTRKKNEENSIDRVDIGNSSVPEGEHKKWLIMNYVAADCNLQVAQYKNLDNQEQVGSDKNTHIVAMIDIGPFPGLMDESWSGARTYYINGDNTKDKITSPVISEHGNHVDMSDMDVMTKFIADTIKKFPSDYTDLVLNDHGGGWTGALADDHDGRLMKIPQIRKAIEKAEEITGKKLDIIGFDACLMADTQVAYELKDTAKILLASEETEGGKGWTYSPMLGGKGGEALKTIQDSMTKRIDVSPEEFAKTVVKVNGEHQKDIPTFSATDLTKMDDLAKAADKFAGAVINAPDDKFIIRDAIKKAQNYAGGYAPYGDMRDFYHMAELIEKDVKSSEVREAAKEMKETIKATIIENEADEVHRNSHGIHVYTPVSSKGVEEEYKKLNFAQHVPRWVEMLNKLGGHKAGMVHNEKDTMPGILDVWPDGSPKPGQIKE